MYAVIRAGGKQYRVAPGDVIRIERTPADGGTVEFNDILAVSGQEGQVGRPQQQARVVGTVVEEGRGDKVLVFHYKRKKQYKKLRGHRQGFTAVRITEIAIDGQSFKAPEQPAKAAKPARTGPATAPAGEAADVTATPDQGAKVAKSKKAAPKKSSKAKPAAKKPAAKKGGKGSKK